MLLQVNWYKVFYWMGVADNLSTVLGALAVILSIVTVLGAIGFGVSSSYLSQEARHGTPENQTTSYNEWVPWVKMWRRAFTMGLLFAVISLVTWALVPTKRQMMLIIAGGAIGNFVSKDSSSQAIPAELTRYVRNYLKKEADDVDSDIKQELGLETPKDKLIRNVKDMTKEQIIEYLKTDTTLTK